MAAETGAREHAMSIETLKLQLPDYAKDLKLNIGSLAGEVALTTQQRAGTFIASALASRNADVTRAIFGEFAGQLSPEALAAARAAAAIMAMNNVYYRFTHLVGGDYPNMPARLRMNVMARPGVDKADFELWSLAVSAVNGCGMCMESHEKIVRAAGLTQEQVQAAVRIAAVVHAVAATLDGEAALAVDAVAA
jgi:alkyl hydroperoxide reductase subunit D